jgi:hypothetical protein
VRETYVSPQQRDAAAVAIDSRYWVVVLGSGDGPVMTVLRLPHPKRRNAAPIAGAESYWHSAWPWWETTAPTEVSSVHSWGILPDSVAPTIWKDRHFFEI